MISDQDVAAYRRDGYIVVPDVLGAAEIATLQAVIDDLIANAANVDSHDDVYDLEPSHTRAQPRVRRIKAPHKINARFMDVVRHPRVLAILSRLLGPDLRLYGSKLNMKAPRYGSPVEWHQDWAFYPHTNDDVLAIGVMLDDMELSNGPLLVVPGSHTGPVYDHHADGTFCGAVDPATIEAEIDRAVPLTGRAGSMSFHHVRLLHGSALNTSNRRRQLLLYEVTAADAWPLRGVTDLAAFDTQMIVGQTNITPRLEAVPVRMPLPPATHQGSIYENQMGSARRYFAMADAVN
ncbi:MAG: phytanoyl-CoA dioxygenase family protein [Alphaproteobacteria bacterium]|nr:phytanoyl-CoA dioxygenase family protein [Alphaproteobacteria bacterium]